jgi:Lectin C-type domain
MKFRINLLGAILILLAMAVQSTQAANLVYNPANGNYYEHIFGLFSFDEAMADAQGRTYEGCTGHLVTITSAEEDAFLATSGLLQFGYWIGAVQSGTATSVSEGWTWVTGEAFVYTHWMSGEPNDGIDNFEDHGEDALQIFFDNAWNDSSRTGDIANSRSAYIIEYECTPPAPTVITVSIDVKLGSSQNCINNNGNGVIPVAILGSATFDVTTIDANTVSLERMTVRVVGRGKLLAHIEDVNGDGFNDLILQIQDQDGMLQEGSGTVILTGALTDGTLFAGTDSICIVPA